MSFSKTGRVASFGSLSEADPLLRSFPDEESKDVSEAKKTVQSDKMWALMDSYLDGSVRTIQRAVVNHVEYTLACNRFNFDISKAYRAAALSIRDRLIESWNDTNAYFEERDVKRVNYLSLEFLMGRSMQNALLNMDLESNYRKALMELGFTLEDMYEQEQDAALGNGGLGRLAACFLDSMATLDLPAWGYGIRYNYGIFKQKITDGRQVEVPDYWLTMGNPWEIERLDVTYPIRFYGHVRKAILPDGEEKCFWEGGEIVQAVAYDNPIPGWDTWNTINLRLWKSMPSTEFDLDAFSSGDYMKAVDVRQRAETITHVLYPSDSTYNGKELRLKQQFFFVSATLQDVIRRFKKRPRPWSEFPKKNAIQLNDTHPSIGIAELMRILVDLEGLKWDDAWKITQATFAYTNHTILPEALEKWSVAMMGHLLPRHLEIIYKINYFWMEVVEAKWPGDGDMKRKLSIVSEEGEKSLRMAHLSIIGSHTINGVAAIHSELVKFNVFPEFFALFPEKFQNKTNGVTPRRWMNQANPGLSAAITSKLKSDAWLRDLSLLTGLRKFARDPELHKTWMEVKFANKIKLADRIKKDMGIELNPKALFDVQVKRIHEYKRQLLNALYCIHRYTVLKSMRPAERAGVVKRVVLIGGKAAPGYVMAKRIIRLIHAIADKVNNDPDIGDLFKVVFMVNYNVSYAEDIIPASDLSQHISTAGMEASGTSNMKFAMNGGLIIGTMDGANIEIAEEIGVDNMFIFGAETPEVATVRTKLRTEKPPAADPAYAAVLGRLAAGDFGCMDDVPVILDSLRWENDYYLLGHDFADYVRCQSRVDRAFVDEFEWTSKSILSTAGMGKFSTDRTIGEYAKDIWDLEPVRRPKPEPKSIGGRRRSFANMREGELPLSPSSDAGDSGFGGGGGGSGSTASKSAAKPAAPAKAASTRGASKTAKGKTAKA